MDRVPWGPTWDVSPSALGFGPTRRINTRQSMDPAQLSLWVTTTLVFAHREVSQNASHTLMCDGAYPLASQRRSPCGSRGLSQSFHACRVAGGSSDCPHPRGPGASRFHRNQWCRKQESPRTGQNALTMISTLGRAPLWRRTVTTSKRHSGSWMPCASSHPRAARVSLACLRGVTASSGAP